MLHRGLPRSGKFAAALAFMALAGALGAGSGIAGNPSRSCPVQSAMSQPFAQWGDNNSYFLAPAGDMESSPVAAGWSLSGGASLVSGNESYYVGNASDSFSLGLPAGSSATTPQICVTIQDPQLRFFVLNTGDPKSQLDVQAVNLDPSSGKIKMTDLGTVKGSSAWSLSNPVLFKSVIQPGADGTGLLGFTFSPKDGNGNWRIDDLYIDPLKSQGANGCC